MDFGVEGVEKGVLATTFERDAYADSRVIRIATFLDREAFDVIDEWLIIIRLPDGNELACPLVGFIFRKQISNGRYVRFRTVCSGIHTIRLAEVQIYVLVDDPEYGQAEQFVISGLVKYFDLNEPVKIRPPITPSGDLEEGWSLISPVAPKKKTGPVAVEK